MRQRNNIVVYKHTNLINRKVYIGQTANLKERWKGQGKNYFNSPKFFHAIHKYGWDNFSHEIIASGLGCEEADKLEMELIAKYDSISNGYNQKEGGWRGDLSEESLRKMSESLKRGYIEHPERREKISRSRRGKKMSADEVERMRMYVTKHPITIGEETGGMRYWQKRTGAARDTMRRILKEDGMDALVTFIKRRLEDPKYKYERPIPESKTKKAINQYTKDGTFVKTWGSIKEAALSVGVHPSVISSQLHGRMPSAGGYKWSFYK